MTFEQMRNAVVAELEAHIGRPVKLSEQISDIPDFPYCYYSVLAPASANALSDCTKSFRLGRISDSDGPSR